MRGLWGTLTGAALAAAVLAASSGAGVRVASGDTCSANGSGTAYSLNITIPASAPVSSGFAFGAPGAKVTNVVVSGTNGTLSTSGLPAGTSGAWIATSPLMPGSVVANVTTTAPIKGAFRVVGMGSSPTNFYAPISCAVSTVVLPSNAFSVAQHFTYQAKSHAWQTIVTVPGPGSVSFAAALTTTSTAGSKQTGTTPLYGGKVVAQGAGQVKVMLRPTAAGLKTLASNGSIKTKLTITFTPKGGKPASKLFSLSLKTASV